MKQAEQNAAIEQLLKLKQQGEHFNDERWTTSSIERYFDQGVFEREQQRIMLAKPQIVAHSGELAEPNSFTTFNLAKRPVLLTRDGKGKVRAFYNVCRHRGARLVDESSGCKKRFSCPYHAWTWTNTGKLMGVPHQKSGFPDLDKSKHGLAEIQAQEFAGWIWISFSNEPIDVKAHLGELTDEFGELNANQHTIFQSSVLEINANWKILVEGGIEAYHFKVAHRDTIAPLFLDNLSSYQMFGPHMRSILPRSSIIELTAQQPNTWNLREHANILYTLFPGSQFLVQEDHFVWIQSDAIAADKTILRLSTMIPSDNEMPDNYWQSNHELTMTTLDEDFALAEGIQKGLTTGANQELNFGRFEGALATFNDIVDRTIN